MKNQSNPYYFLDDDDKEASTELAWLVIITGGMLLAVTAGILYFSVMGFPSLSGFDGLLPTGR